MRSRVYRRFVTATVGDGYAARVGAYLTLRRAAHASPVALAALIAVNAIPLVGVLWLGWDLPTVVAVYWAENGVVGVFAVARMLTAGVVLPVIDRRRRLVPQPPPPPGRAAGRGTALQTIALSLFFCAHYGLFWVGHGIFVWLVLPILFAGLGAPGSGVMFGSSFGADIAYPDAGAVLRAAVFLLISHGVSFVANWLLGGEHASSTPEVEMRAPYARVVVLHLTILFGAFGVALFGARAAALVVLVVVKTAVDLAAHLADRRRASDRASGVPGAAPEGVGAPAA